MYSFWGELVGMLQSGHDEKKKIWPEKGEEPQTHHQSDIGPSQEELLNGFWMDQFTPNESHVLVFQA